MNDWDIRLECTICGKRIRRCRSDGNPPFGKEPPSTVVTECCECNAETLHFVDYSTEKEDSE